MNRIVRLLISGLLLLVGTAGSGFCADAGAAMDKDLRIVIDGVEQQIPAGHVRIIPSGEIDKIYISARAIAAGFHKDVTWDGRNLIFKDTDIEGLTIRDLGIYGLQSQPATKMTNVHVVFNADTLVFNPLEDERTSVNHREIDTDPALNVEGRIYLPLEKMSILLQKSYRYDSVEKLVVIGWKPYAPSEIPERWALLKLGDWMQLVYPSDGKPEDENRVICFQDSQEEWSKVIIHDEATEINTMLQDPHWRPDEAMTFYKSDVYHDTVPSTDYGEFNGQTRLDNGFWGRNYIYPDPKAPEINLRMEMLIRQGPGRIVVIALTGTQESFKKHYEDFHKIAESIRMD